MTPTSVIKHFGGITATADALGISRQAVHKWVSAGSVPRVRQYHIEARTDRKLRAKQ